jgi:CDGSH-type Zn-finger protein
MKKSQIILTQYSPLMVVDTSILASDNSDIETPRVCSLCRCGESKYKPKCDGSHSLAGFVGTREDSEKNTPEHYAGKDITIVFDRYLCMGNGACGELEAVFGTHDAPKYEPDAASVDAIIATIRKCPSGALSYVVNNEHLKDYFHEEKIVVEQNGPLHVQGKVTLIDDQDSDQLLPMADHYTLCRCGGSKKKPLCDGSHEKNGFKG